MKNKVSIIHNSVAQYRHSVFENIFQDPVFDVTVYYCRKHLGERWNPLTGRYNYRFKFLKGVTYRDLSFNPQIVSEMIKERFSAIMIGGWMDMTMQIAFIFAKLLQTPVILWTEGFKEPKSLLGTITRTLRSFFIRKADAILVPGQLSKNYAVSMGANKSKVFIAPNSIDNQVFKNLSSKYVKDTMYLKEELQLPKGTIILYVGQLIERKGVDYLLRAYDRLRRENNEVRLVIVGSGPLKDHLNQICRNNGILDVHFVESGLKLVDLVKYYSIADIFVLPTLMDVWGFVINEAMACGLPVIATQAAQAAREMICPGENGYIIKEANEDELYHTLKKLTENPNLRKEMAKKSIITVESNFNTNIMAKGCKDALLSVLQ